MKNLTFDAQISSFSSIIYELLEKNLEILSASQLTDATKKKLNSLHDETTSIEDLKFSLRIISNALYTYYHQKSLFLLMNMMFHYNQLIKIIIMMKWLIF